MLGFRGHFSTRTRHYSTTLAHLRAERTAWRTDQLGHAGDDRAGHSTDLTAGHAAGHRRGTGQPRGSDTTLVISHWQYAGTGLLPELAHLSELLTARRPARPESLHRHQGPGHPGDRAGHAAGHRVGQSTGQLTGAVRAGVIT